MIMLKLIVQKIIKENEGETELFVEEVEVKENLKILLI